jgi:hypothetical protein
MPRTDEYRRTLEKLKDWTPFLLKHSGLPGPRGNLELAAVVAELADKKRIEEFLSIPPGQAKENTARVFLVFCGVSALGKRIARGEHKLFTRLRKYASDPRWRVREAAAIALQYVGDADMDLLLKEARAWSSGDWYERRAAAAALAEPRLLKDAKDARRVLQILERITTSMESAGAGRDEGFKVLRQAMGYCWSVAVAALPAEGRPAMQKWLKSRNPDVRWVMKENLKKSRLVKMDAAWTRACIEKLGMG